MTLCAVLAVLVKLFQDMGKSDENVLNRMMGMLEQVMERVQQGNNVQPEKNVNFRYRGRARGCGVCGNSAHSTKSHCLKDRLCLVVFLRDMLIQPVHSLSRETNRPVYGGRLYRFG